MILGMSMSAFTTLHVLISVVALVLGAGVLVTMLRNRDYHILTALFLATTIMTSGSGFMFPATAILPSHIVGFLSLGVLIIAIASYYALKLSGRGRGVYVISALTAFYLNSFVALVQAFLKVEPLHALAPTASNEPAFVAAQTTLLIAFVTAGFLAMRRFHLRDAQATNQA
jgi:hypothetical protein